jgi:small subunit ribosomal protein S13
MVYIFETEIRKNKTIGVSLQSILGLGRSKISFLCKKLGFSENLIVSDMTKDQIFSLIKAVKDSNFLVSNELVKFQFLLLQRSISVKSYRGLRRIIGLPVRGQRTRTNSKTAKRFKKTIKSDFI